MAHNKTRLSSSKTSDIVPIDLNDFDSINEVSGLIESISPKSTFEKTITNIVGITNMFNF